MRIATVLVLALALAGCELLTDAAYDREPNRREDKTNGDILVDVPAGAHAWVFGREAQQTADGSLAVEGLPSGGHHVAVIVDDDGDGVVDARADIVAELRVGELANPGGNPFGGAQADVVGNALLGAVELGETATVRGLALIDVEGGPRPAADIGATARVVAFRAVDVPAGSQFLSATRGIEAEAVADETGAFELVGVGAGVVQIAVFVFDGEDAVGALVGVSDPLSLRPAAGDVVDLGDSPIVAEPGAPEVGFLLASNPLFPLDERVTLNLWRRGSPTRPECAPDPDNLEVDFTGDRVVVPAGLYDLVICLGGDVFSMPGLALPTLPADAAEPIFSGLVALAPLVDATDVDDVNDRDRDGRPGLPLFFGDQEVPAEWTACVDACRAAHGAARVDDVCAFEGRQIDCDDDGDGQADVTEPIACYGVGLGGDRDGDGLCDPDDPFPFCAANRAASCDAETREHTPVVPANLEAP